MKLIERIRRAAVEVARREWSEVVRDEYTDPITGEAFKASPQIIDYHEDSGAAWPVADGYQEGRDFWCGVFVAYCYSQIGVFLEPGRCVDIRLKPRIAHFAFPSTSRLDNPDKWREAGVTQAKRFEPESIQPGDVVVFRTGRTGRPAGDHVTIAEDFPRHGSISVIEGNGWGPLGDGSEGEGVVRDTWSLEEVARVWRLDLHHFEGEYLEANRDD